MFGIKGFRCDGNDAIAVLKAGRRAIKNIRRGEGPFILECRTYRWKGHVGPDCDAEKGCRPKHEIDLWTKRCPIKKLEGYLSRKKIITKEKMGQLRGELESEINDAVAFAKNSPFPDEGELYKDVYYREAVCPGQS
ncbi:MAG: hypothetical protein AUJ75_02965 [Candidatus Omnitrophica bacterium CG1_02_49_10]|nr:MAG: hypothetical protein AUJ75_02965 [Candidatus Omnitrophica bacterium CG1_02_49_10]